MTDIVLATDRLHLRWWRSSDKDAWYGLSSDPVVMATLGPVMGRDESDAMVDQMVALRESHPSCFWALERRSDQRMIGFCGLKPGAADTPIAGHVEIGWRLASDIWGEGYAREAAEASIAWGWRHLACPSIWAITSAINHRSWGLMERLGMVRETQLDFDFPGLASDDPLRAHITYSIRRS